MNRRLWTVGTVAALATAAGVVWRARLDGATAKLGGGHAGAPDEAALADFWQQRVERPDGSWLELGGLRGRRLIVNFWATWCPPCVREMPLLNRFHREFGPGSGPMGWQVLGLAIDRRDAVVEFLRVQPVGYEIALAGLAGTNWSRSLGNESGGLPFTVAISESGDVVQRKLGEISEPELRAWARG